MNSLRQSEGVKYVHKETFVLAAPAGHVFSTDLLSKSHVNISHLSAYLPQIHQPQLTNNKPQGHLHHHID